MLAKVKHIPHYLSITFVLETTWNGQRKIESPTFFEWETCSKPLFPGWTGFQATYGQNG